MTLRFILRANPGQAPELDAEGLEQRLRKSHGVQVLDRTPRMLLVGGERAELELALHGCRGWTLMPESTTPLPDPRPRLKGKASG